MRSKFLHDLTNLATTILGDSTVGPHLSVLPDILDSVPEKELSVFVVEAASCTFGLVNGLARSYYSLASVATAYPALHLTRQLTTQLLHPFETVRQGADSSTDWLETSHIG